MDDTARLVATILLAAFVIERAGAAFAFFADKWPEKNLKIARFAIAAVLGAIAVWLADIRVLARLQNNASPWIDYPLSWLILVAGADRIRDFVGGGGGGEHAKGGGNEGAKAEVPPVQISITDKEGRTKLYELKED